MSDLARRAHEANTAGKPDPERATRFLLGLLRDGLVGLASIHPKTKECVGFTFSLSDRDGIEAWIHQREGTHNLYFMLNEPNPGLSGRAKETDIARIRGVGADLDPRGEVEAEPGGFEREQVRLDQFTDKWIKNPISPPGSRGFTERC